jgi:hypothetical protein
MRFCGPSVRPLFNLPLSYPLAAFYGESLMVLSGAYITIAGRQALLTSPVYSEELWVYREDMKILKKKKIQNRFLLKKVALES